MSSYRQGLTIVGQVVGSYFGPVGAAIGGQIGGYIGGSIDGPQKGPRLDDTSAPQIEFGGKAPRVYGRVWCTLTPLWWTGLRRTTVNSGGKGAADETVDNYIYHCDMLGRLADGANVIAWTRIRIDGKIVASQLSDSSAETLAASANTDRWADVELRTGAADQAPWSVMEAAEGAGNVSAYRDQCTIGFTNLLMQNGRNPSLIEVEVITAGTNESQDTRALYNFTSDATDETSYGHDFIVTGAVAGGEMAFTGEGDTSYAITPFFETLGVSDTYTVQGYVSIPAEQPKSFPTIFVLETTYPYTGYLMLRFSRNDHPGQFELFSSGGGGGTTNYTAGTYPPGRYHFCIMRDVLGLALWINGERAATAGPSDTLTLGGNLRLILGTQMGISEPQNSSGFSGSISSFKITYGARLFGESFTPPSEPLTLNENRWTPGVVDLQDVLEAEMLRCEPLTLDDIDMSAAAGKQVWGFKASRTAAAECAVLLDWYYLDIFCGDKITVVERGGAVEQTIPYGYSGSAVDGTSDPFAGLIRGADVESQFSTAVQYINILADGEVDTQQGQRVGTGSEVRAVNFSIYSKATEAKGRADTITHDTRVAAHTATIRLGARQAAFIQPASVLRLVDNKGNSYRVRVLRLVWNRGVYELDVCLDDPNILKLVGITTEVDTSVIEVAPPAETEILLLDGPIFRNVDDDPGFYAFAKGAPDGSLLFDGDNAEAADFSSESVFGDCSTTLGDWAGGAVFDEVNTVTVDVGSGQLSTSTRAALLGDQAVNICAIGVHGRWEGCQFRTASLTAPGVYVLSGLLRGVRGTEWAISQHESGEQFVLITTAGRRAEDQTNEIGVEETYTAVTKGRSLGSGTTQDFTNNAVGLKPFAPVHLRLSRDEAGSINVAWTRRTRYATRFASSLGIEAPLGETTEAYRAEIYEDDTFTTLVRTIEVTAPTAQYTLAQQIEDFGSQQSTISVNVYQMGQLGAGYAVQTSGATPAVPVADDLPPSGELTLNFDGSSADSTGTHTPILYGDAAVVAGAYVGGGACEFGGAGYVRVDQVGSSLQMGLQNFTFEVLFKLDDTAANQIIFIFGDNYSARTLPSVGLRMTSGGALYAQFSLGEVLSDTSFGSVGGLSFPLPGPVITAGVTHHAALQRNGERLEFYVNGALANVAIPTTAGLLFGLEYYRDHPLLIGGGNLTSSTLPLDTDCMRGVVEAMRVRRGEAVYSGTTYTVPTGPF